MKVLYLTNIHNPYRDAFFEKLGQRCDLTVVFEKREDAARDKSWFENARANNYKEIILPERENGYVSRTMLNLIKNGNYSAVVVGCYNTPRQIAAIEYMRHQKIAYIVNSDGAVYDSGGVIKRHLRRHVLNGANAYLVAGKSSIPGLRRFVGRSARIVSYPLSSLDFALVQKLASSCPQRDPNLVLIVGQFEEYKGLDVALEAIKNLDGGLKFRFVGAGQKARLLESAVADNGLCNVEVIPFIDTDKLFEEYLRAGLFVLPSRQECWGLVVNEAAACGCPIVGTWGSGAAVEFLSHDYPQFLAEPDDSCSLAMTIDAFLKRPKDEKDTYSQFLRDKASLFTVEGMVEAHLALLSEVEREQD